jgi:hypothetical protein
MLPSVSNFPLPGLGNDFGKLLDQEDTKQLMQTIKEIRCKISGIFDASEILQRLDIFLNKPFQSKSWLFSSPAGMSGTVILIAPVSFVVYKKGCPKSSSPNTDISSPSAPPPPTDVYMQELAMLRHLYNYANRPGTNPGSIPEILPPPQQEQPQLPKSITIINS